MIDLMENHEALVIARGLACSKDDKRIYSAGGFAGGNCVLALGNV
jgi:hypothetical protein